MIKITSTILLFLLLSTNASAEGMTFGIAGKRLDDINFITVWQGCQQEAQKFGDTCIHIGEQGPAHFRIQDISISNVTKNKKGIDGLAVSVINSGWLAKYSLNWAFKKNIPIITFDSDLHKAHAHLRSAYIGMDNLEVGRELGRVAKKLRPQGGTIWLMSSELHNNLNERLMGIRQELSGNPLFPSKKKLAGEGGWTEHRRSAWNCADDEERSIKQMEISLADSKTDVFVSVGHWPIVNTELYRRSVTPLKGTLLDTDKKIIIIAVGELLPEQMELLNEKLLHAYVALDFEEMGRKSYYLLKNLVIGKKIPQVIYTGTKINLWNDKNE